jgi:hypothetical protein
VGGTSTDFVFEHSGSHVHVQTGRQSTVPILIRR